MPLNLEEKKAVVADISDVVSSAVSLVAAEYKGLTVSEMTNLRATARDQGIYLRVVKNTLAKRAFVDTAYSSVNDALVGPLMLAFTKDELGTAAKLFYNFAKTNDRLIVKIIALDGKLVDASQLEQVAMLPTKEEALAQFLAVMKAPIAKFVRTAKEPVAKFVRTTSAVGDKKGNN